jgi:hypothetical protein
LETPDFDMVVFEVECAPPALLLLLLPPLLLRLPDGAGAPP